MNIVVLKGNLTRDPQVREITVSGKQTHVANFALAVNRHFKRADGQSDKETTYVDCEVWDTGAVNFGKFMKKGDPVLINGSLKLDQWETDGQKRSKLKVRVSNFDRLFRAPQQAQEGGGEAPATAASATPDGQAGGDDIPF